MRRLLGCVMMALSAMSVMAAPTMPDSVAAYLDGSINEEQITLFFADESGNVSSGENIDLSFEFPMDQESWSITQALELSYSANLVSDTRTRISFDVSPLKHDDDNVVDTTIALSNAGEDSTVDGETFVLDVPAGYRNRIRLGSLNITVRKPREQKLIAGSYHGSIVVNMNSI